MQHGSQSILYQLQQTVEVQLKVVQQQQLLLLVRKWVIDFINNSWKLWATAQETKILKGGQRCLGQMKVKHKQ
ncbi:MAG: hypothetical protein CMK29_01255 [Porticoccaceae bacterium]|nr:hypothetical protein [Porticoccaceae bacterium]